MKESNNCSLYILGHNSVGKTTLRKKIIAEEKYTNYKADWNDYGDWIIEDGNYRVNVGVKELATFDQRFQNLEKIKISEKSIIILMISDFYYSHKKSINSIYDEYLKDISKDSIIIVLYNTNYEKEFTQKKYSELTSTNYNIREVLVYNLLKEELHDFKYLLKNVILNSTTNRLDPIREIIANNLKTKEKTLNLGNCSLTSLHEIKELFENTHLENLILSNEWAEFENGKWHKRKSKNNYSKNSLGGLPSQIQKLTNLRRLTIGGDWKEKNLWWNRFRVFDLSPILKLTKLEYLNVSNNKLLTLPSLARLKEIKTLHLNNNEITSVKIRSNVNPLQEIFISNNQISTVSFIKYLPSIKTIDLHGNKIKNLLPLKDYIGKLNIANSKWEKNTLNIAKNPLEQPPMEIVNIGNSAIISYFSDIAGGEFFINKDVKLILVGNSEVGKTTLAKYLNDEKDLEKDHLPTHWMEEKRIKSKHIINKIKEKCNINLFDFGGHDYFHDTHHLFFGKNTVYLLLWDYETNTLNYRITDQLQENNEIIEIETQDYPIKYWLESIKYFIKGVEATNFDFKIEITSEYNSHSLVIQNKVNSGKDIVHLNNNEIISKYSFIYDFANISLRPKRNLDHLDNLITEIFNATEIIGAKLPKYYDIINKSLKLYKGEPILTITQFKNYCNLLLKSKLTQKKASILANYLGQIGSVLFYPESINSNKIYIDKKWVISAIYKVLEGLNQKKGEFNENHIKKALGSKIKSRKIQSIIELMIEFKLIFKHPESNNFIAPLYLPKKPIQAVRLFIDAKKIPYRKFLYKGFINKSIILNFFQEYGKLVIRDQQNLNNELYYYWKDGLVIKAPKTNEIVLIQFHLGDNDGNASIDIVKMNNDEKTEFVDTIIKFITEINNGYEIEEMITVNSEDFIPLSIIHENEINENWNFLYKKKYYKLLDFKKHLKNPTKMKRIFISYSKQDIGLVNKFIEHLSALQQDGKVAHWYCSELEAGSNWEDEIQEHFDNSDIVCFMVSPNFMKTKYILDYEITKAFEKKVSQPDFKIIPIILDFCRWTTEKNNLGQFTALPYTAKPIVDFNNQNMAWYIVQECIRLVIEENIDPKGDDFYSSQKLPSDVLKIYKRIVEDKIDNNVI